MAVGVDDAGHERLAAEVKHARLWAFELEKLRSVAYGKNAISLGCQRLGNAIFAVDGYNLGIGKEKVGVLHVIPRKRLWL
jgi:hypothetical protein